jgi:RND family efflux transporter MFP subunit
VQRRKVELAVERARHGLRMLEVRAPHDGLLLLARDRSGEPLQVGAQVWRGQPLAEIPDLSRMEAEVFVLEADAGGIAPGQTASVALGARPESRFAATVRRVDPVARPKDRGSPVQYFGVALALDAIAPELMKSGQRVEATVAVAALDDVLVVPRQAVVVEGGGPAVWVRRGRRFAAQAVTVGPQSAAQVVIESGLDEGDVVALARPRDASAPSERGGAGGESAP